MEANGRVFSSVRSAALAAGLLIGGLGGFMRAEAQQLGDVHIQKSPLVLRAQGS